MTPNPFLAWLPSYPAGAVPERPWWRRTEGMLHVYTRTDGAVIESDNPNNLMEWIAYSGTDRRDRKAWARTPWPRDAGKGVWAALGEMMTRLDTEHPLPVPGPMCGQVWASGLEQWKVEGIEPDGRPWRLTVCTGQTSETWANTIDPWPPPGAVLVAGVGAPRAPAGWAL